MRVLTDVDDCPAAECGDPSAEGATQARRGTGLPFGMPAHGGERVKQWVLAAVLVTCASAQTSDVIAYTRAPEGGPPWPVQDVCTVSVDGLHNRCLTQDGHSHDAVWSADGKRIVFIHDSTLSTPPRTGKPRIASRIIPSNSH